MIKLTKTIHVAFISIFYLLLQLVWSQDAIIEFAKQNQVIDGFGGSSAWCGEFNDALMDAIFKNGENQLGFTILHNRIDPKANAWGPDKINSARAKARGAVVFATPWSPPESLKTNKSVIRGYIDSTNFEGFTNWMKSYVTYCGSENVDIMSIENEPDFAQQTTYESCGWSATNLLKYCKNYASKIGKPVMIAESAGFNWALSDPTLNDTNAAKNVSYIGGHLYGTKPLRYAKAINLGKHVWMTEWNSNDYSGKGCMVLAKQMLDCMYQDFNAYVYWWMTWNGNGIISKAGVPNKYGYHMSMFARWVRPGYYRVDATYQPQTGVYVVAFNGARNVVVVVNTGTFAKTQSFIYSGTTVVKVNKYVTSQSKNAIYDGCISATNNSFFTSLDPQSITTLVSEGTVPVIHGRVESIDNASLKVDILQGQSDAAASVIYLLNGKRGCLPKLYNSKSLSNGVYIMDGKIHSTIGNVNSQSK